MPEFSLHLYYPIFLFASKALTDLLSGILTKQAHLKIS